MTSAELTDKKPAKSAIAARVHRELHERPPLDMLPFAHVHHVAYLLSEQEEDRRQARAHRAALFQAMGIREDQIRLGERHAVGERCYANGDILRITWELHSEFVSYSFTHMAAADRALGFGPLMLPEALPDTEPEWERILAIDLLVVPWPRLGEKEHRHLFGAQTLFGSQIQGGKGQAWTSFRLDHSGWEHYLILACEMTPTQLGRQVKRLLELENYYHLILMPLDEFRAQAAELRDLEVAFARKTQEMFRVLVDAPPEEERRWLGLLTEHSAKVTRLKEVMRYRLGAARSYHELFHRQLKNMNEGRVEEGHQPLSSFLIGRVDPAVRGYVNFNERLDSLSRGLDRATNMLRTRVDMTVQRQNLELMEGMARQGRQQLMLQTTVEGLSVIVLSYYLTGLFGYLVKALDKLGWLVGDPVIWQGGMLPLAVGVAVAINAYVHRLVHRPEDKGH